MRDLQSKFEGIWRKFCHFWIFWSQNRFFCPMRSATLRALMIGRSFGGKVDISGFFYENFWMLKNGLRILSSFGWPKGSKTPWKWPFCHFLYTQEPVLGDWTFGGSNGHQIKKFHLGWKVDRKVLPTSYHEINFDFGKFLQITSKVVLRIEILGAVHRGFWPIFHYTTQNFT